MSCLNDFRRVATITSAPKFCDKTDKNELYAFLDLRKDFEEIIKNLEIRLLPKTYAHKYFLNSKHSANYTANTLISLVLED